MQSIYFIRAGRSALKIGRADNVFERRAELQTGNHERLEVLWSKVCSDRTEARRYERALQCMFVDVRTDGGNEWFRWSGMFAQLIEDLKRAESITDAGTSVFDFSVERTGDVVVVHPRHSDPQAQWSGLNWALCGRCNSFGPHEGGTVRDRVNGGWIHINRNTCDHNAKWGNR